MARKQPRSRGPQLKLAGDFSVAFANTAGAAPDNRQLGFETYADVLVWGRQVGTLSTLEAERLGHSAAERPRDAETAFARIAKMRLALFRIFLAVGGGRPLPQDDLAVVNEALSSALAAGRLVQGEEAIAWGWAGDGEALERVVWPVLDSARDLLLSLKGRPQVRQCARKGCRLFFIDRSPSGQKRWCERKCGHRV